MQKEEAVMWFGSQRKLAKFLGVAQSNVCSWKKIPRHHQVTIEKHTNGELIAIANAELKRNRYMCTIEQTYIDTLQKYSTQFKLPAVEILRRAISLFDTQHSNK